MIRVETACEHVYQLTSSQSADTSTTKTVSVESSASEEVYDAVWTFLHAPKRHAYKKNYTVETIHLPQRHVDSHNF